MLLQIENLEGVKKKKKEKIKIKESREHIVHRTSNRRKGDMKKPRCEKIGSLAGWKKQISARFHHRFRGKKKSMYVERSKK